MQAASFLLTGIATLGLASLSLAQGGSRYADPPAGNNSGGGVGQPAAVGDPFSGSSEITPLQRTPMQQPPMGDRPQRDLLEELGDGGGVASPPPAMAQPATRQTPPSTYGARTQAAPVASSLSNAPSVDSSYAEQMMQAALEEQPSSRLSGSRVGLAQVVQAANSRSEQSELINAYWDLCSATADYYLSLYEQAELARLASRSPQLSTPLRAAIMKLTTRRDTSLTAARATQLKLATLMRREGQSLPLPGDMPLCSAYHTRYSQNFPGGGPQEATELHKLLPLRHAELLDAASGVSEAEEYFDQVVRQAGGAADAQNVVNALQLLALNRRAFVQIARDYNRRITRYTELAKPGDLRTERLVAMLIKTTNLATRSNSQSGPPSDRRSDISPPATFRSPLTGSPAPTLDPEVLPAGRFVEDVNSLRTMVEKAAVERVNPDEASVLVEQPSE